ncbi:MAG: D-glycero-beta-D-manno-heptose 1-phosphate adenylyltransferase [Bacteroidales bacterium]|nr:D-glycero-beta-D-manno-heptose 1-phosphate adenylyltransferase [Bacteroidales bacterium]MCF8345188.1 D-glycero-beta-D-manno-heptose 1-phosphate adenylyltransferase [Bacteroidales bacterium]MCF8350227.1 D-glycero-beta-D-manno-heptose 1-phosphate adenylyltransferase [Bacteroidales bacterium]MCF8375828.1 D-glycero-beta-D-manno-heptose 1-phosphate adenylyltransferase [Bacteroidales bacterium]MCF8401754.1 D-glycero-beta-D-manno-heptose 1-phosphate adenylyltransferase [Bacteroidales bacterium]
MTKLEIIKSKIYSWKEIQGRVAIWRFKNKKVVFTNGCFDIVHLGHIDYLSRAADEGDALVVGLNTDDSVRRLKGDHRPLNDQNARSLVLASLHFIDAVVLFDQDTPYELIRLIQPDVLVKGSDYKEDEIVGADIVKQKQGKVVRIDLVPGYSTSGLEKKIREQS